MGWEKDMRDKAMSMLWLEVNSMHLPGRRAARGGAPNDTQLQEGAVRALQHPVGHWASSAGDPVLLSFSV